MRKNGHIDNSLFPDSRYVRAWTAAERAWIEAVIYRYGNLAHLRGEEIEKITPEISYQAFKHAWIMKQVAKKRFRSKGWRERDAKRAEKLANAARYYWHVMNTPVLAKGGPLSERIAPGRPCSRSAASTTGSTPSVVG